MVLKTTSFRPNSVHAVFAGLILLGVAVFFHPLEALLGSALVNEAYFMSVMVLPISAGLLWRDRITIPAKHRYSTAFMVPLLVVLGLFAGLGDWVRSVNANLWLSLSIVLFAIWCVTAFIISYGLPATRKALCPLLILFLMVPLPQAVLQYTIRLLQLRSADATSWLFQLANIPCSRDGVVLTLPRVTIEIAQECSGIRSSLVLLVASLLLAHLFLKSRWSQAVLLLLVLPVMVAKNGIRIFVLATLGMYVNPVFLTGWPHHKGGAVFFALAFAAMWGAAVLLQKCEARYCRLPPKLSPMGPEPAGDLP